MHIPDGILPATVCAAGYASTGVLTWLSLRKIHQQPDPQEGIPRASLLAAAFFAASWVHIPVPPASVHLVLNGLLGAVLGYYAFPAILVGLFFQAVMFQHGGITTLGVNATLMGAPALLAGALFRLRSVRLPGLRPAGGGSSRVATGIWGFLAGAVGPGLAAAAFYGLLITFISDIFDAATERAALLALLIAHIPLLLLEGVFTALVVLFLLRVRPELLGAPAPAPPSAPTIAPEQL